MRTIPIPLFGLELSGAPLVLKPAGAVPLFECEDEAISFSQICSEGRASVTELQTGDDLAIYLRKAEDLRGRVVIWNPRSLHETFTCEAVRALIDVLPPIVRTGMDHRRIEFPVYLLVGPDEISPQVIQGPNGRAVIVYDTEEESAATVYAMGWPSGNGIGISSAANLKQYLQACTSGVVAIEWILRRPRVIDRTLNPEQEVPLAAFIERLSEQAEAEGGASQN